MAVKVPALELTKVVRIEPGEAGDSSRGSSGSPETRPASRAASVAHASLAHSTRPNTASTLPSRKSVTLGGLQMSATGAPSEQPSWIDQTMEPWENAGGLWSVAAAVCRFVYKLLEITIVRPVGFALASVAAVAYLVAGVVMGIIGVITYPCCPDNLVRAKALLKMSKFYADAAQRAVGNPLGLVGRTALAVGAFIFALPALLAYPCAGSEPAKACLRYAAYNAVCASRHVGQIAEGILTGVPSYFLGKCGGKSLKRWYWNAVAEHTLPKVKMNRLNKSKCDMFRKELLESHKDTGFYRLVNLMTGGVSVVRSITYRNA